MSLCLYFFFSFFSFFFLGGGVQKVLGVGGPEQRGGGLSVFEALVRGGSFNFQQPLRGGSSCYLFIFFLFGGGGGGGGIDTYLTQSTTKVTPLTQVTQVAHSTISFPEPMCLLVSIKTRSSGIINKLVPRALVSFTFKI